jgi:PAS domain S-box-containing protein
MKADLPINENERLDELYSLDILDTESEKIFDELVALAARLCDTPIALISIVDKDRQWFKSKLGLTASETHRDLAFCAHAIHSTEPLIVNDATKDSRFSDNLLVTGDPEIRFYAGIPLVTSKGYALGTLCTIDTKPKEIPELAIETLKVLAKNVIFQLELKKKNKEVQKACIASIASERKLEKILSTTSVFVWTSGVDKKCDYFNQSWLDFTGRTLEQELGDGWVEGVHPADRQRCFSTYSDAFEKRAPFSMNYRLKYNDGTFRWIEGNGNPWFFDNDDFGGYVNCCHDIHEKVRIEEESKFINERYDLAVQGSSDGIWDWIDVKSEDEWWSKRFYELLGYADQEIPSTRSTFKSLLHKDDVDKTFKAVNSAFEFDEPFNIEYRLKTKSGVYRWFQGRAKVVRDEIGNPTRMSGSITDITARKRAENDLKEAVIKAESATKSKALFLANMSHEIRTPLTAIIGFTETAKLPDCSPELMQEALDVVSSSSQHLLGIINDILDLSKLDAGAVVCEKINFSVVKILLDTQKLFQLRAKENGLSLNYHYNWPLPSTITGDPLRLKQVLLNLIGNAIKFTKSGSVDVTTSFNQATNKIQISIKDTGIGLTTDQQATLFTPFTQADTSTSRKFGGTGLGLSITKQLLEMMSGTISVNSIHNKGSVFTVELDTSSSTGFTMLSSVEQSTNDFVQKENNSTLPTLKGKILIAEDVAANRRLLEVILRKTDLEIVFALNGREAIEATTKNNFDLILMDMQMPEVDGFEATKEIRSKNKKVPIIAFTANALNEDIIRTQEAGCNSHLDKPLDRKQFIETLMLYLSK